jgi:hypothetical protein
VPVIIWSTADCNIELDEHQLVEITGRNDIVIHKQRRPFYGDISSSLAVIKPFNCSNVLTCRPGAVFGPKCLQFIKQKTSEYGEAVALTGKGVRIFPHYKASSLKDGLHYKLYDQHKPDRAVHIFTPDLSLMSTQMLNELAIHCKRNDISNECDHIWCSYLIDRSLGGPYCIWKISVEKDIVDLTSCGASFVPDGENFDKFYSFMFEKGWPVGVDKPLYDVGRCRPLSSPAGAVWDRGFGGVNMSAEPASSLDFQAAASCGVTVVRWGAVADASDLSYLLDKNSESLEEDVIHFHKVLPRLRKTLCEAGEQGLKVIITMADLPGALFHKNDSSSFWTSPQVRYRAAKFWGLMADGLKDLSHEFIAGYDLINEPYTPLSVDYLDDVPMDHFNELETFYKDCISEIRHYDRDVKIIVSSINYAHPKAVKCFRPFEDQNVIYSFHVYTTPILTLSRHFSSTGSYPGLVRRWPKCPDDLVQVDKRMIYKFLKDSVYAWQKDNNISSSRIFVGEVGICREVPGAMEYLRDCLEIFKEFGWSWCLFSFRDEEWDAMDYELGSDLSNMLDRSLSPLFLTVAKHFH